MKTRLTSFALSPAHALAAAAVAATFALAPAMALAAKPTSEDRAEARIKDLHAKLEITAAQEDQWAKLTQQMRDDAKNMDALTQARVANASSMNAVQDLQSYSQIADAHANGLKTFIPLFETLYLTMSDAQKKNADVLFESGSHKKMMVKK